MHELNLAFTDKKIASKHMRRSSSKCLTMCVFRINKVPQAHRGSAEDLDQAIALAREALALHPVGHTDRSKSLGNLANLLSTRFDHQGNAKDLDQAIALHREALALNPVGHTDRSWSLNNFALQLSTRFHQAIALLREALALHPVGHTDRSWSLNNLAILLSTRFDHRGDAEDLDQAIAL
ncbi:hypothetical protein P692DRAFT_20248238, partial [Suillus brevipes Sb2]